MMVLGFFLALALFVVFAIIVHIQQWSVLFQNCFNNFIAPERLALFKYSVTQRNSGIKYISPGYQKTHFSSKVICCIITNCSLKLIFNKKGKTECLIKDLNFGGGRNIVTFMKVMTLVSDFGRIAGGIGTQSVTKPSQVQKKKTWQASA